MHLPSWCLSTAIAFLSLGCASHRNDLALADIDSAQLPRANISLEVKGIVPCTDRIDRLIFLNSNERVIVLVHGSNGSPGGLRGLAQALADKGQQSVCFAYDDRAGLNQSSAELASSIRELSNRMHAEVTVLGYSQGALIARKALTDNPLFPAPAENSRLRLVTVAGPFSGIEAAHRCGSARAKVLSLGTVPLLCRLFAGKKWTDITYSSDFIENPGRLRGQVHEYLKIDTDERNTCRRTENGQCAESDYVFALDEQRNTNIERAPDTQEVEIQSGHVEIVGGNGGSPSKLISILQGKGIIHIANSTHTNPSASLLAENKVKNPQPR